MKEDGIYSLMRKIECPSVPLGPPLEMRAWLRQTKGVKITGCET